MVFLHGGGQTRRSWARAAAAVAERGWQAVTVDFRGHGESDWSSEGDYRVVTFAEDVREVLRSCRRTRSWWAHPSAASPRCCSRRAVAGHRQRRRAGRHRAEHEPVRGGADPRLHGRPDGGGLRLTRRGGRHDRRVQPASAPAHRSEWLARQPASPRRPVVLALGSAVHRRHRREPADRGDRPGAHAQGRRGDPRRRRARCCWCAAR